MNELNKLNKTENLLMKSMNQIGVMRNHMKMIKHIVMAQHMFQLKKVQQQHLHLQEQV